MGGTRGEGLQSLGETSARRRGGFLWPSLANAFAVNLPLWSHCPCGRRAVVTSQIAGPRGWRGLVLGLVSFSSFPPRLLGLFALRSLWGGRGHSGQLRRLGAPPRLRLGWEVTGGATWDVQSDGQLLQLVQAVAGACQVGWSGCPGAVGVG
jgi:hypothetical protein